VIANLSTAQGRNAAVAQVLEQSGGVLDRLICCAGVGVRPSCSVILAVNYFGVSQLLDGFARRAGQESAAGGAGDRLGRVDSRVLSANR
jgi:hypothetical protein